MTKKKTIQTFIKESKKVFGDRFKYYPNVPYPGGKEKITIYCNKHQKDFTVLAVKHTKLQGGGCKGCIVTRIGKEKIADHPIIEEWDRKKK